MSLRAEAASEAWRDEAICIVAVRCIVALVGARFIEPEILLLPPAPV